MLLTHPQAAAVERRYRLVENDLRGTLRNFGLKVGIVGRGKVRGAALRSSWITTPRRPGRCLLNHCSWSGGYCASRFVNSAHRRLLAICCGDDDVVPVCLMTVPGVGPVAALTFRATVDAARPASQELQGGRGVCSV